MSRVYASSNFLAENRQHRDFDKNDVTGSSCACSFKLARAWKLEPQ